MERTKQARFTKEYNSIDVLKFVLSVFVMVIHSGVDKTVISPLLRTAVPLFFIISGYFFFAKNERLTQKAEKRGALVHFIKRNLILYLFWTVLQLPFVMVARGYFRDLFPKGILSTFKDVLLGNGFTGSWYILALVIGVVVIYWLSKKISAGWLVLITLPLYVVCCLITNYGMLFDSDSTVTIIGDGYQKLTGIYFYTSFPVALFWVSVGRFLAEKKLALKKQTLWFLGILSALLLALERYAIVKCGLAITDDCYFFLVLLCPAVFMLVRANGSVFKTNFKLREMSVLIYVTHGCCERIVGYMLKKLPFDFLGADMIKIAISLVLILMVGHVLIYMRERCRMGILQYAF